MSVRTTSRLVVDALKIGGRVPLAQREGNRALGSRGSQYASEHYRQLAGQAPEIECKHEAVGANPAGTTLADGKLLLR